MQGGALGFASLGLRTRPLPPGVSSAGRRAKLQRSSREPEGPPRPASKPAPPPPATPSRCSACQLRARSRQAQIMASGDAAAGGRPEENGCAVCMFPVYLEEDKTLFFQEDEGIESDSWKRSKNSSKPQIFRNVDNYILIVKLEGPENQTAAFEDIPTQDRNDESGIWITIQPYKDTVPRGQTVALTMRKDSKTYCLCAEKQENGEMQVVFQEGNIPEVIPGEASNIIFFQIPFSEGDNRFFKFESSLQRGYFLAFERGEGSHTRKLIMKRVLAKDEVDETTKFIHSPD